MRSTHLLTTISILLLGCGTSSHTESKAPVAADDAGSPAASEQPYDEDTLLVHVIDGSNVEEAVPLEGAVVGWQQDGVTQFAECDAQGQVALPVNPQGGPLTLTASREGSMMRTFVGYERARMHVEVEPDGVLLMPLIPNRPRIEARVALGPLFIGDEAYHTSVESDLDGEPPAVEDDDRIMVTHVEADRPFTLTAYEQSNLGANPDTGLNIPMASWRTYEHPGSSEAVEIAFSDAGWEDHALMDHSFWIDRPERASSLGSDETAYPFTYIVDPAHRTGTLRVADIAGVEKWRNQSRYKITISGPREALTKDVLTTFVGVYDQQGRYTRIGLDGKLPDKVEGPYLPPTEARVDRATNLVKWTATGSTSVIMEVGDDTTTRWTVRAFPGVTQLDIEELVATFSNETWYSVGNIARLNTCDAPSLVSACKRQAGGVWFSLF